MTWNSNALPENNDQITMLLVAPMARGVVWMNQINTDTRFRMVSISNTPEDAITKVGMYNPDVVLVDAGCFDSLAQLMELLTKVRSAAYVILPQQASADDAARTRELSSVKAVYLGDANIQELVSKMVNDHAALRLQAPALARPSWTQGGGVSISGLRVVTVWNRAGGVGKSTISVALAHDAVGRGLKTLVIGLSTPDASLPAMLKLRADPNMSKWMANPTFKDGIVPALQTTAYGFDCLVGLQESLKEQEYMVPPDAPTSVNKLVMAAAYGGYAVIILDTPVSTVYPSAISASNTLLLVSTPTVDHAIITAEANNVVFKRLAGQHRVGVGNCFVVLNRCRKGLLNPGDYANSGAEVSMRLGGSFPSVITHIPDIPEVAERANSGQSPMTAGSEFATPIHELGDSLFGMAAGGPVEDRSRTKSFMGIKIRMGK